MNAIEKNLLAATAVVAALFPSALLAQANDADQASLERVAEMFTPAIAESASFNKDGEKAKRSDLTALQAFFRDNQVGSAATTKVIAELADRGDLNGLRSFIARMPAAERNNFANALVFCPKIIGGSCASITHFPWLVNLRIGAPNMETPSWCGGARISRSYILTAAHCVDIEPERSSKRRAIPGDQIIGFTGSDRIGHGPTKLRIAKVFLHRDWKEPETGFLTFNNDLALLKLAPASPDGPTIRVRSVPVSTNTGEAWVAGWGRIGDGGGMSQRLQAARVRIADQGRCAAKWRELGGETVTAKMVCAGDDKVGFCDGDSGGPLVIGSAERPQLIGVVSWGDLASCRGHSSQLGMGKVFARVAETLPAFFGDDPELKASWTDATPGPLFEINHPNDQ